MMIHLLLARRLFDKGHNRNKDWAIKTVIVLCGEIITLPVISSKSLPPTPCLPSLTNGRKYRLLRDCTRDSGKGGKKREGERERNGGKEGIAWVL